MRIKVILMLLLLATAVKKIEAQTVVVTDDNTYVAGQASSVLDVKSTAKGFLAPRMTAAQRAAIASPTEGLLVYQTDGAKGFYYYSIAAWTVLASGTGSQWTSTGNNIYYNTGNVGIGVNNPTLPLVVKDTMEIRRTGTMSELLFTNTTGTGDLRIASDGGDIFWQGGGARSLQMGSYWGMVLAGDRQTTTAPAFVNGSGNTNVLALAQRDGSIAFAVQANSATQTANLMEWRSSAATLNVVDKVGKMGIGITAPSALLHVKAGTAAAGTAPLKLTTGTNLTTVEDGAVEYDGTNYFASSGTVRYTMAKTLTTTATIDFPATAGRSSSDIAISLPGALTGDVVLVGVSTTSVLANSCYTAYVSAANTVTVRFSNYQAGTSNPTSGVFRVTIIKY